MRTIAYVIFCWLIYSGVGIANTYDPQTRILTLPNVSVDGISYTDVKVRLDAISIIEINQSILSQTKFDPVSVMLDLPSVNVQGEHYSNVKVKLDAMEVISVGGQDNQLAPARLYVNIVAHNEDTATGSNADCQAFFSQADQLYADNSEALDAVVRTIKDKGASFNFQTDVEYLNLVLSKEGKDDNILRRLATSYAGVIEIDAHAHESRTKNYADVANLVERVSGVRNGIVGGFTAVACRPDAAPPEWEKFMSPLQPASGLGASFNASLLTLGSSAGHVCDPNASGIWRPKSENEFFTHDENQPLVTIGTGYYARGLDNATEAIKRLVTDMQAGKLEPNRIYTASITIGHCNMHLSDTGETAADVARFIDSINALDDETDFIRWATFSRMVEIWQSEYGAQPSIWLGE